MSMSLGTKSPMTDINVTPLIDVVLVMLIIFMVLTPLAEKQMYMRVPEFEPPNTQVVPPDAVPPDQIVLTALKNGRVLLNKTEMTVADAMAKLKPVYEGHLSKVLFFNAQDGTRYEFAVTVLDEAHKAGVNTIGMMTDPPMLVEAIEAAPAGDAPPAARSSLAALSRAARAPRPARGGSGLCTSTRPPSGRSNSTFQAWRKWRASPGSAAAAPP